LIIYLCTNIFSFFLFYKIHKTVNNFLELPYNQQNYDLLLEYVQKQEMAIFLVFAGETLFVVLFLICSRKPQN
jgi:hypothetical protein